MKLKLNPQGFAVVRDGKPVYILDNGTEQGIDGAAAMKLALGKHFEASPVMAGLKIPHDVAAAFFGDSFHIQAGKLVALDKNGIQMYSGTRHGEVANFDEALAQLVDRYPNKDTILRESGAPTPTPSQQGGTGSTITRAQFEAMPQASRAKFFQEGGSVSDGTSVPAPVKAPAQQAGDKKVMTRAQFDATPNGDHAAFFKAGGKIID